MLLEAEHISKKYYRPTREKSHFEAVTALDFSLEKGSLTEITGRSGSGKSTLLYMLSGLLKPTTGSVFLHEEAPAATNAENAESARINLYAQSDAELSRIRNKRIGVIPQGQTGLHALTVLENVLVPAALYGSSSMYRVRAMELLAQMGIEQLSETKMSELSGGEMRRMAIARALLLQPQLIFADEPTDDLDDENTESVLSLLRRTADSGTAVLLVTHEAAAARYADARFRMDAGVLQKQ